MHGSVSCCHTLLMQRMRVCVMSYITNANQQFCSAYRHYSFIFVLILHFSSYLFLNIWFEKLYNLLYCNFSVEILPFQYIILDYFASLKYFIPIM